MVFLKKKIFFIQLKNYSIVVYYCVSFRCDSVIHMCIFFFRFFSLIGYYKVLSMVPCVTQLVLVGDLE